MMSKPFTSSFSFRMINKLIYHSAPSSTCNRRERTKGTAARHHMLQPRCMLLSAALPLQLLLIAHTSGSKT